MRVRVSARPRVTGEAVTDRGVHQAVIGRVVADDIDAIAEAVVGLKHRRVLLGQIADGDPLRRSRHLSEFVQLGQRLGGPDTVEVLGDHRIIGDVEPSSGHLADDGVVGLHPVFYRARRVLITLSASARIVGLDMTTHTPIPAPDATDDTGPRLVSRRNALLAGIGVAAVAGISACSSSEATAGGSRSRPRQDRSR